MILVHIRIVFLGFFASIFIAGCASITSQKPISYLDSAVWTGRLAIQVKDQPSQSFSANFQLHGSAERGELNLMSPLGNTLALLAWQPQNASLQTGSDLRSFTSLEALIQEATGTAIPVTALFDWLTGIPAPVEGWQVDLSQRAQGRVLAYRTQPATTLRLILEP